MTLNHRNIIGWRLFLLTSCCLLLCNCGNKSALFLEPTADTKNPKPIERSDNAHQLPEKLDSSEGNKKR
ncbi:MAG: hypothetical protein ACPGJI_02690 [Kangiellaceae bacterium]